MKALVIPFITLQLAGSLMVLVLFSAYQKGAVLFLVLLTMYFNLIIMNLSYFKEKKFVAIEYAQVTKLNEIEEEILKSKERSETSRIFFESIWRFLLFKNIFCSNRYFYCFKAKFLQKISSACYKLKMNFFFSQSKFSVMVIQLAALERV